VSFAAMMVHVDIDPQSDDRVRLAANLAQRFGSALIGISAAMLPADPSETAYFVSPECMERICRSWARTTEFERNESRAFVLPTAPA
jgi:hypothetical protein